MTVTAEDVKAYREATGIGMHDARRILEREDRLRRIEELRNMMAAPREYSQAVIVGVLELLKEMNQ